MDAVAPLTVGWTAAPYTPLRGHGRSTQIAKAVIPLPEPFWVACHPVAAAPTAPTGRLDSCEPLPAMNPPPVAMSPLRQLAVAVLPGAPENAATM
ncbi:hypothetical protein ABZ490_02545 [Streptomyces sp. NPDC005811]|uniref:hypothetical protein n=1 Tax=Streptomyces sp. NPDC005811 TaxID=3154565 RepID=UPI003408C800